MPTYDEYMAMARKADTQGNEDDARRLVQLARQARQQVADETGFLENVGGFFFEKDDGVVTPGERAGRRAAEIVRGGFAATARGLADVPAIPVNLAQLATAGYEWATGAEQPTAASRFLESLPETRNIYALGGLLPGLLEESQYRAPGTLGEYISTAGEFGGGAGGISGVKSMLKYGVAPGVTSEAAGQAMEGTSFEAPARIAGALVGPSAYGLLEGAASSAGRAVTGAPRQNMFPSVDDLKAEKNAAYKAAEDSGIQYSATTVDDMIARVQDHLDAGDFLATTDDHANAALVNLKKHAGQDLTLSQMDKIRRSMWKRYNASAATATGGDPQILDMIDIVDKAIDSAAPASEIMATARLANSRYAKSKLLEAELTRAERGVASSGSRGNVVNRFRQAVASILNNPRKAKYFTAEEVAVMDAFINGKFGDRTMRTISKLSPTGNGLMQALNIGAVAYNPAMAGVSLAGLAAANRLEAQTYRGIEDIQRMLATGQLPVQTPRASQRALPMLPGLLTIGD